MFHSPLWWYKCTAKVLKMRCMCLAIGSSDTVSCWGLRTCWLTFGDGVWGATYSLLSSLCCWWNDYTINYIPSPSYYDTSSHRLVTDSVESDVRPVPSQLPLHNAVARRSLHFLLHTDLRRNTRTFPGLAAADASSASTCMRLSGVPGKYGNQQRSASLEH
jgi:hypothetical protein